MAHINLSHIMALSLMFGIAASGAAAQTKFKKRPKVSPPDCYCTDASGDRKELGEFVCLTISGRSFLAQCKMAQNNPIWREVSNECLSS
ncbi:MAG: hypothetical protein ABJL67_13365 [Sulfitobacter sp.]